MWEHMKGVTSMCRRQPETQPSWAFCPSHACFRWQIRHTDREPKGSVSPVRGTLLPMHFPLFLYMQIYTNDSRRVLPFSAINCISELSTRQRNNRFIFIFSRHVFCLLMTGNQPFSSLNYLCSEATALSHFVLTGLSISRTNERERMRMKMWLTVWTQTGSSIFTHSSKRKLQRDTEKTVGLKLKSTRPK